jgi:hypothetical protein
MALYRLDGDRFQLVRTLFGDQIFSALSSVVISRAVVEPA